MSGDPSGARPQGQKENVQRIKFITDTVRHKAGDIAVVSIKMAKKLIKEGKAVITKDMTSRDYKHGKSK